MCNGTKSFSNVELCTFTKYMQAHTHHVNPEALQKAELQLPLPGNSCRFLLKEKLETIIVPPSPGSRT